MKQTCVPIYTEYDHLTFKGYGNLCATDKFSVVNTMLPCTWLLKVPRDFLNIKMPVYRRRDSHYKDKTTVSYLWWGSSYLESPYIETGPRPSVAITSTSFTQHISCTAPFCYTVCVMVVLIPAWISNHMPSKVWIWDYCSIPKLHWLHRWSLWMHK